MRRLDSSRFTLANLRTAMGAATCAFQALITITGAAWFLEGDTASFSVACGALLLTLAPARVLSQAPQRNPVALVVGLLAAAHVILGMRWQLYELSVWYDKVIHVIGSAAIAAGLIVATRSFCRRQNIALPTMLFASIIIAGTVSVGTIWEILEFAVDRTGLFFAQRSLQDTMIDLIADAIGAVIAVGVFLWVTRDGYCKFM